MSKGLVFEGSWHKKTYEQMAGDSEYRYFDCISTAITRNKVVKTGLANTAILTILNIRGRQLDEASTNPNIQLRK
ncbi:MAG: hypothetical protein AB4426_29785 [Xenococcaceae cyanobacterium]